MSQKGIPASLKASLMNHTSILEALSPQLALARKAASKGLPFVLSQVNSVGSSSGVAGVSDTFGAALSALDFALAAAAGGVSRVHMHQVGGAPASAWQPSREDGRARAVLPAYYGHLAAAAMVGAAPRGTLRIAALPIAAGMSAVDEAAYAAFEGGRLARVMLINMKEHESATAAAVERPHSRLWVRTPGNCDGTGSVSRLFAPGMDSTTGISFNGTSYSDSSPAGAEAEISAPWNDQTVEVGGSGDLFYVDVPYSSAVMVSLKC
jgi:hypothetical protein